MNRIGKEEYYLNLAKESSKRGTCLRRNFGAIIVKNDQIISTGYTGAPRGRKNCCDIGGCIRDKLGVKRGTRYELCRSVHAEMNAIIHASRNDMMGATLYLYGVETESGKVVENAKPCRLCTALIINAGIEKVIVQVNEKDRKEYNVKDDWVAKDETLEQPLLDGY